MSMTREEAIKVLKNGGIEVCGEADRISEFIAALDVALDALIPPTRENELEAENIELKERIVNWRNYMAPTREQVEKVFPGCDYCKHAWMEGLDLKPCAIGNIGVELTIGRVSEDDAFGILAYYRNAAAGYIDFPFCPFCGRPMTEEAVQMVLERLEALYENRD